MDDDRHVGAYSWHQSLDQATVNIFVPHETILDDLEVVIDPPFMVAGIRGQTPLLKGRIYEAVNMEKTHWNFEPTDNPRRRTASTASTVSTQSSYAYVSDPEISSSFAASLDSAQASDNDSDFASPERSHPVSRDEQRMSATVPAFPQHAFSYPGSPQMPSMESSLSSLDSLQPGHAAKLLTIILVKERSTYWPRVVDGSILESYSPIPPAGPFTFDLDVEQKMYNVDPTSLGLLGEEYLKARNMKEDAFEYFVRSWHYIHTPFSAMRLVAHYLPVTTVVPSSNLSTPTQSLSSPPLPPRRGTVEYYVQCLGGPSGLAQLFLEAGLAHLDGIASKLLSTNYSPLNSLRKNEPSAPPTRSESSTQIWKRDRACARTYFERARKLAPSMDGVPYLPEDTDIRGYDQPARSGRSPGRAGGTAREGARGPEFQMPSLYVDQGDTLRPETSPPKVADEEKPDSTLRVRRRRQQASEALLERTNQEEDEDSTWYLYLPGLVGAGTALLVVSVVGALSFQSWRKNNN
ncbi:hypothetical protein DFH11DRAFT_862052 [Phellopilus nigrolimitatus]|nr:hypothetical protein DFH11DRAFT_862052 [Phellopilus nigrolimitatus]